VISDGNKGLSKEKILLLEKGVIVPNWREGEGAHGKDWFASSAGRDGQEGGVSKVRGE